VNKSKTAIILCGGNGSRLGSVGKKIPKTLVLVKKKPILWYILNELIIKHKFNHFILPIGHKGKMIQNYIDQKFRNKKNKNVHFDIIDTGINTCIAKRIYKVSNKIISNHFLLLNGDAIFNFKLDKIFNNHIKKNLDLTMLTCKVISPFGVVIKKKKKLINFQRDMNYDSIYNSDNKIYGEIFTGMSIIKTKLLEKVNFKKFRNFEINFYPKILTSNKKYKNISKKINGFWYAMDDLKQVEIANKNKKSSYISKKITIIKKKYYV